MSSIGRLPLFKSDGRVRGCYVYLLLCESADLVYVKAGHAADPIKRLHDLLVGCPLKAQVMATCELPSRFLAVQAERSLHKAFEPWHAQGEWFRFEREEKPAFNAAWREVFDAFHSSTWKMHWTKMDVQALLDDGRDRQKGLHRLIKIRGRAYRDFSSSSPRRTAEAF